MPQASDADLIARILEDAETTKIAAALGLEPEDYAKRVLFYLRNPKADPQLQFMSPADAEAAGMPSMNDCKVFLEKLESGEISLDGDHASTRFAGFDSREKSAANLTGGKSRKPGRAPPMPGDPPRK